MKKLSLILETNWEDGKASDIGNLNNKLIKHYKDYNDDDKKVIANYTVSSRYLNSYHWNKSRGENKKNVPELENTTGQLDNALDAHRTPHKLSVYSGTKDDPRKNMDKDGIVNHPAYLSTSIDNNIAQRFASNHAKNVAQGFSSSRAKNVAQRFASNHAKNVAQGFSSSRAKNDKIFGEKHVLKINIPKNHPGGYIAHHSSLPEENEFILPRNTKLKYRGTVTHKGEDTGRDMDIHEHNMDVI
jgi:type I site-specific restriction endonuclease